MMIFRKQEREEYETTFADEERRTAGADRARPQLNEWVFNEDTIRQGAPDPADEQWPENRLRRKAGQDALSLRRTTAMLRKSLEVFGKEYPHLPGYAKVIDNYMTYAQSAIDEFSDPKKLPQIAISVDMLDTGIDVPEVLNLVFFKKVMSKAKFWQMIGRGTRLCSGLDRRKGQRRSSTSLTCAATLSFSA